MEIMFLEQMSSCGEMISLQDLRKMMHIFAVTLWALFIILSHVDLLYEFDSKSQMT